MGIISLSNEDFFKRMIDAFTAHTIRTPKDRIDRLIGESEEGMASIVLKKAGAAGANGLIDFGPQVFIPGAIPLGRDILIESLTITPSQDCLIQVQHGGLSGLRGLGPIGSGDYIRTQIGKFQSRKIEIGDTLRKYRDEFFVQVREQYSADPVNDPFQVTLDLKYRYIDGDRNLDADKSMLIIGTSISNGTGATTEENTYVYKFANWLRDNKGYDIRVVNRSVSGSWSVQHETYRKLPKGRYNNLLRKPDLVLYEQGANDVGNGVSAETFAANVKAMARHHKNFWLPGTFLCLSTPGYSVNTGVTHATLQSYRASNKAEILTFNDPKIRFVDETYAWDETTQGAANTTDSVHPNDAGHEKIYQGLVTHFTTHNLSI